MKMTPSHYRCPLGRLQPEQTDVESVKQRGWREEQILVVSEADARLNFVEREFVRRIASVKLV